VVQGSVVTTPAIVKAMGIAKLGDETEPVAIAKALDEATDESWQAVTSLFLQANYSLRLYGEFACDSCHARNDVDAPYDREFFVAPDFMKIAPPESVKAKTFPSLAGFAAAAAASAERIVPERLSDRVKIDVTPESDAPPSARGTRRSSYAPASEGAEAESAEPAKITVFYDSFAASCAENASFDWKAELDDAIEHELAHHLAVEKSHEEIAKEGSKSSD
ncbi:MAG TPA: metallopeptidase family protein, partial [Polyangiaceae bacterium]